MSIAPPENAKDNCSYSGFKDGSAVELSLLLYPGKNFVNSFESMQTNPPGPTTSVNGRIADWLPDSENGVPGGFLETVDGDYMLYLIVQAPDGVEQIAKTALQASEHRLIAQHVSLPQG